MKKLLLSFTAIAALLVTSCTQADVDEVQIASGGEGVVTFTVKAAQADSRAIADGKSATDLVCGIYDANWNYLTMVDDCDFDGVSLTRTFSIRLVNSKTYNFVFWADCPDANCYALDLEAAGGPRVDVTYDGLSNDESRDAFFGEITNVKVEGTTNIGVTLRRPFAQVNFATDDTAEAKIAGFAVDAATTKFTTQAYTTLLLGNNQHGKVEGLDDVVFRHAAQPAEPLYLLSDTDKQKAYDWLAMNYILASADESSLAVCTMEIKDAAGQVVTVKYPQAPVKRNYRTTLLGSLLTDQVNIEVEIDPIPEDEYVNATGFYIEGGVYHILDAKGLDYIAAKVNEGDAEVISAKIVLENDIDLAVTRAAVDNWVPIGGMAESFYEKNFSGIFDGQGHSIKNMVVTHARNAGLFGCSCSATIKNLTMVNPVVKSNHYAGAIIGWVESGATRVVIENCHVIGGSIVSAAEQLTSGDWDNGDKVGSIAGFVHSADVKGCSATDVIIQGYRDLGGIIGYASGTTKVTGNSVDGVVIAIDNSQNYKNYTTEAEHDANAYVGQAASTATVEQNSGSVVVTSSYDETKTLAEQVGVADATIVVPAGEYELPTSFAEGVTLVCEPGTVFNRPADKAISLNINGATVVGATFKGSNDSGVILASGTVNGSFKNCVFEGYNALRWCYPKSGEEIIFEGCTFSGQDYAVHFDSGSALLKFIDCVFEGTFTIGASLELYVEGCEFRAGLTKKYNIPNFYGKTTVVNSDFVFDGTATVKQSIRVYSAGDDASKYVFNGCTVVGEPLTSHLGYLTEKLSAGQKITIDGKVYEYQPTMWSVDGVYQVADAAGLLYLVGDVLKVSSSTLVKAALTADIDLAGETWPVVVTNSPFEIDGQGYAIKNVVANQVSHGGFDQFGLFNATKKAATFHNLVIDGATVVGNGLGNSHGAILVSTTWGDLTVEDVTIKNSTISACDRTGGVTAYLYFKDAAVKGVKVEGCTFSSIGTVGAILGMNNNHNITISDCEVAGTVCSSEEGSNKAGLVIGTWQKATYAAPDLSTCTILSSKAINAGTETNNIIGRTV